MRGVDPKLLADPEELKQVEPSLSLLDSPDERLLSPQAIGKLHLS